MNQAATSRDRMFAAGCPSRLRVNKYSPHPLCECTMVGMPVHAYFAGTGEVRDRSRRRIFAAQSRHSPLASKRTARA